MRVRLLTLLSPHVCRAIAISDALNLKTIRSEALEATLSALTSGVYLVDRLGRVIYMNQAAEHQVKANSALHVEHDHLVPLDRVARIALAKAIGEAMADEAELPAAGITLALPDGRGAGLVATVLPLGRGERRNVCGAFAAMAAIFVQDPVVVPPFPGRGVRQALWSDGRGIARASGHGAGPWRQGGGRGAGHQRDDGENAPATHLR